MRAFKNILKSSLSNSFISFGLCLITLLISCSREDADNPTVDEPINLTLIGEDLDKVYQYDYNSITDEGNQIDLSSELGITNYYLTLRQLDNEIFFFTYTNGAISLYQKNLMTSGVTSYPEFYNITSERSLIWGLSNETSVYFGLYKPFGSTNLALHIVSLETLEGFDISLEFGIKQLYQPLYHNGKLIITYRTGDENYKVVVFDTISNNMVKTFEFGTSNPSILITENGELAIFTQMESENTVLELYDLESLLRTFRRELQFDKPFSTGPINGTIQGNKLYYEYSYPQPFSLVKGPAIFDIESGNNTVLDLLVIIKKLKNEQGLDVQPIIGQYLSNQNVFAISYVLPSGEITEPGGFLLIDTEGKLIAQKNLSFVPTYFVD